eukprot:7384349-Prymnesium_polylepis.1
MEAEGVGETHVLRCGAWEVEYSHSFLWRHPHIHWRRAAAAQVGDGLVEPLAQCRKPRFKEKVNRIIACPAAAPTFRYIVQVHKARAESVGQKAWLICSHER